MLPAIFSLNIADSLFTSTFNASSEPSLTEIAETTAFAQLNLPEFIVVSSIVCHLLLSEKSL